MAFFIEELAKQHLWYWLETEKGWEVDGEVKTTNGRIDLAARTQKGDYVGIELKASVDLKYTSTLSEQIQRYIDSEEFDKVFYAGPSVDGVTEAVRGENNKPAIAVVREACKALNSGVAAGEYDTQEVLDRIDREVSGQILSHQYSHDSRDIQDYIERRMDYDPSEDIKRISIQEGIRQISNAIMPETVGVIEVPLPVQGGYLRSPRMALTPGENREPQIIVEPESVTRSEVPEFDNTGEPWIRHRAWCEFGGIPEGHIPNVMESKAIDRPIDLLAYDGDWDPSKIVKSDLEGDIIGIEAKGENGIALNRTQQQLREFLETGVLSQLYLAVPTSKQGSAITILEKDSVLEDSVGLIAVDRSGAVEVVRDAPALELEYDGYKRKSELYKTGYGEIRIPNSEDVHSPFDLSEWREPLTDDENQSVIWGDDPRGFIRTVEEKSELDVSTPDSTREELKQYCDQTAIRSYLLRGLSAAPYAKGLPDDRLQKKDIRG